MRVIIDMQQKVIKRERVYIEIRGNYYGKR